MPELRVNNSIQIPLAELKFTFARSSGPGGQNVNKVNSKAMLRWAFDQSEHIDDRVKERLRTRWGGRINKNGEIVISDDNSRDQRTNIESCLEKLRVILLDCAAREKTRRATRPSRGSIERRITDKKQRSETKRMRRSPGAPPE
ncbi:aminoacyl-tRNA hydrolase [Blastopirellula sp. JC732]|uniref:Aminoacyl-tRNA hydrolase n=1 Tax=Blastopirellula sediminis TaxID=2894196 RepID=A0A9X1MSV9_9BACT|nr:alternative ribosome rescue aminoacyl-tRNA hydrolase ArfB [Blastopirellula sediminis]MCC9604727.1 aminoacyl-tRNA hydrolase [Blastopirellula sediminis]MCC9631974.1 aminoacyl-tRNA hydrolase [Blastopirellula sediminis]